MQIMNAVGFVWYCFVWFFFSFSPSDYQEVAHDSFPLQAVGDLAYIKVVLLKKVATDTSCRFGCPQKSYEYSLWAVQKAEVLPQCASRGPVTHRFCMLQKQPKQYTSRASTARAPTLFAARFAKGSSCPTTSTGAGWIYRRAW